MMGFNDKAQDRPFPEILAAYADGELDAAGRARVEAWLVEHPEGRAELDAQRRLSRKHGRLWHASAAPSPGEKSWSRFFHRLQTALHESPAPAAAPVPAGPVVRRFPSRRIAAVLAAAAAVLLAVALYRPAELPPTDPVPSDDLVFVVADDSDIDIQSIAEVDTELLLVGLPPLTGSLVLLSLSDVQFEKAAPDVDGVMPQMQVAAGPSAPMIVCPVAGK